jgi:error-prone DNA polymerase
MHLGGMLITAGPLVEVVPVERATMPGRVVVQWNKDSVEDAGLIKIDLLSLRTLGMVEEALRHIREQRGMVVDLEHLPLDDPGIYGMLQKADAIGCFQVESRAQSQMLPRLRPQCFEDIIVEIALVRPGPIQGNAVNPYLQRRLGLEPVSYLHPSLEEPLSETLGVVLFQEQVMKVAMAAAGFTPAEADQLRRALSRSRSEEAMAALRERFLAGALETGIGADLADQIFQKLAAFAGYGFCKSHAAAFALLAYQTLYLKLYFAPEFFCALLNHQPMGFYSPKVVQGDAERHGVPILPPDINRSQEKCTLERLQSHWPGPIPHETMGIRLGLEYVSGLGEARQTLVVQQRGERAYQSLEDFCLRTRLPKPVVENLIRAGAMDNFSTAVGREVGHSIPQQQGSPPPGRESTGQHGRRQLLWQLGSLRYREEEMDMQVPVIPAALPALSHKEKLAWEYELLGLAPGDHVMRLWREELQKQGVLDSQQLAEQPDGQEVQVAGLVVVRQRPPTAKGFAFITLEDEFGLVNLIIRPAIYERDKRVLRNSAILWVRGQLQREGHALSVLVQGAKSLR